jgi:uncharacterized membrane-anchored protein YhcB (DUF1043 family)
VISAILALIVGIAIGYFWPKKKVVVPIASCALQKRAAELTKAQENVDASGEYKRHVVYAQLLKEFPDEAKRKVSKAIEAAL